MEVVSYKNAVNGRRPGRRQLVELSISRTKAPGRAARHEHHAKRTPKIFFQPSKTVVLYTITTKVPRTRQQVGGF